MINGVEVLTKTEIMINNPIINTVGIIVSLAIGVFMIIALFAMILDKNVLSTAAFILSGVSLVSSIICAICWDTCLLPTGEYEYQVTVDDSVPMNEFYEQYEVISIEGKIYTIRCQNVD